MQAGAHIAGDGYVGRIVHQVCMLSGVKKQIVKALLVQNLRTPSSLQPKLLARAIVAVRQNRCPPISEAPNVLPARSSYCAFWLIGRVIIYLGENFFVYLRYLPR